MRRDIATAMDGCARMATGPLHRPPRQEDAAGSTHHITSGTLPHRAVRQGRLQEALGDLGMPTKNSSPPSSTGSTKLACHNLWKVFGPNPERFFPGRQGAVQDSGACVRDIRSANHIPAVANVSFDVRQGEIFVVMGLSGSGKSTLIRCVSRLIDPTAGAIHLDGDNLLDLDDRKLIELRRHKIGMVFQNFGLLPHLTVLENVAFPLKVQGVAEARRRQRAMEVIDLVGLDGRENAFPAELSGGQQQRVGIARSLAVEPDLWLLDEPFSALDPLIRRQMQDEFVRLQKLLNKTIVFITHDFLEALKIADRIAIMHSGEIVQIGAPADIVLKPADRYVAEFTEDVPLTRVIKVADLMESPCADLVPCDGTHPDTTLEDLLPRFAHHETSVAVTDGLGTVIGQVTARSVVRALAENATQRHR